MSRQVASGTTGRRTKSGTNRSNETSHGAPRLADVPENVGTAYRQTCRTGPCELRGDLLPTNAAARFAGFASIRFTRGRTYEPFCIIVVFVLNPIMENHTAVCHNLAITIHIKVCLVRDVTGLSLTSIDCRSRVWESCARSK